MYPLCFLINFIFVFQVYLCEMNQHTSVCTSIDRRIPHFRPVKETNQPIPKYVNTIRID